LVHNFSTAEKMIKIFLPVTVIFAIPALLFHLTGTVIQAWNSKVRSILCSSMILWLFSMMMCVYFNDATPLNSPEKTIKLIQNVAFIMYFVNMGRFANHAKKPSSEVFWGFSVIMLAGMYVFPNIILSLFGTYPDTVDAVQDFLAGGIWLFVFVRMCLYIPSVDHGIVRE